MTKPVESNAQPVWTQPMQSQTDPITTLATSSMSSGTAIPVAQKRKVLQIFSINKVCQFFKLTWSNWPIGTEKMSEFIAKLDDLDDSSILKSIKEHVAVPCSHHITELGLTDENVLFEIAKASAKSDGYHTSTYIKKYNITSNEKLFELATIACQCNPGSILYVNNYNLTQEQRFKLAITHAKSLSVVKYICKLDLTQEQRFEIVKSHAKSLTINTQNIGVMYDPGYFASYIKQCDLTQEQRFIIAQLTAKKSIVFLGEFELSNQQNIQIIRIFLNSFPHKENIEKIKRIIEPLVIYCPSLHPELEPYLQVSLPIKNPELLEKAKTTLQTFTLLCQLHSNQELLISFFKTYPELLATLYKSRDVDIYWPVLKSISELSAEQLEEVSAKTIDKQLTLLPLVTMDTDKRSEFIDKIKKSDVHDFKLRNLLIKAFAMIKNDAELIPENRAKILSWILEDHKNKKQVMQRCSMIIAIYNLNGNEALTQSNPSYESILTEAFQKKVPLVKINGDISHKLLNTFFASRNPIAICIYAGQLARLKDPQTLENLTLFINSIFDGTFHEVRRDIEHNLQLKFLKKEYPLTLEKYHQGSESKIDLDEALTSRLPRHKSIQAIIRNAFANNHIDAKNFEYAKIAANSEKETPEEFILIMEAELKKLTNLKEIINLNAQIKLIRLMMPDATRVTLDECVDALNEVIPVDLEIFNDLKSVEKLFGEKKEEVAGQVILSSTDNPYEILLCGSEVDGSCQRLDGDPRYNYGLLGYLLNGHTRLITLKEPGNNRINGRAIIRLLVNNNGEPVLLIERIYPETLNAKYKDAIMKFAKSIATELQVPLVGTECKGKQYPKIITCYSTRAPEYVDTMRGIFQNYTIKGSRIYEL